MVPKAQALVLQFDSAFVENNLEEEMIGRTLEPEAMLDSPTVLDVVMTDGATT